MTVRLVVQAQSAEVGAAVERGRVRVALDLDQAALGPFAVDAFRAIPEDKLGFVLSDLLQLPGMVKAVKETLADVEAAFTR